MRLAEISVPKKNPKEENYGRGDEQKINPEIGENHARKVEADEGMRNELCFMSAEDGVKEAVSIAAGKVLLVSEGNCSLFADAVCSPRTIAIVFDGDCLPFFSMPDGVSCVLASGGDELFRAARYFAEVRGIPCTLFPTDGALEGVFESHGEVLLGETRVTVPLRGVKIICDCERLKPSLASAYGRIMLSRLAEIEAKALSFFHQEQENVSSAELPTELSAEEIIRANARQRLKEREGAYTGEGVVLCELLRERGEKFPEWRAFSQLSALYAAFFEKGKPRRYSTPDYRERAKRAGTVYSFSSVPSAEEYVIRAMTLERIRAPFARACTALSDEKEKLIRAASKLAGEMLPMRAGDLSALKILPEHAVSGLTAIIRDFGLMEWDK